MAREPRVMGTAKLFGEVVRFDVMRVGLEPILDITPNRHRYIIRDLLEFDALFEHGGSPKFVWPADWPAWCERNIDRILPALPRAQRKRLEACRRLDLAAEELAGD